MPAIPETGEIPANCVSGLFDVGLKGRLGNLSLSTSKMYKRQRRPERPPRKSFAVNLEKCTNPNCGLKGRLQARLPATHGANDCMPQTANLNRGQRPRLVMLITYLGEYRVRGIMKQ
jgi:hypothetical protein